MPKSCEVSTARKKSKVSSEYGHIVNSAWGNGNPSSCTTTGKRKFAADPADHESDLCENTRRSCSFLDFQDIHEPAIGTISTWHKVEQLASHRPSPLLQNHQPFFSADTRIILLDWMFQVSAEYFCCRETSQAAILYLEKYLSKVPNIPRKRLQLLAVTAMWIASKNKELVPVPVSYYRDAAADTFTEQQIRETELEMLDVLDWQLEVVTVDCWASYYSENWFKCFHAVEEENEETDSASPGRGRQAVFRELNSQNILSRLGHAEVNRLRNWTTELYNQMAEIVDIAVLDIKYYFFQASTVAASAFYLALDQLINKKENVVLKDSINPAQFLSIVDRVTGYNVSELEKCLGWLSFASGQHLEHHIYEPTPTNLRRVYLQTLTPAEELDTKQQWFPKAQHVVKAHMNSYDYVTPHEFAPIRVSTSNTPLRTEYTDDSDGDEIKTEQHTRQKIAHSEESLISNETLDD